MDNHSHFHKKKRVLLFGLKKQHTWNIHLSPTVAPFTNSVLSRVMLACRNAIRSMPVPLNVVGGPSMLNLPVGSTREPCVRILLFSSRAVISSSTRPYVNLLFCVNFWKKIKEMQSQHVTNLPWIGCYYWQSKVTKCNQCRPLLYLL